jgi:hypothetical protein
LPDRDAVAGPVRKRKIIRFDMDAFFASVEQRDNPELRGKPVAVGGSRERGVVAAASYEARTFGVRSAMQSVTAKRRCPGLIFVTPRFDVYKAVSLQIREIFAEHTPIIEPLSLDEAYLDVTGNLKGIASATQIAEDIRAKIRRDMTSPPYGDSRTTVQYGAASALCLSVVSRLCGLEQLGMLGREIDGVERMPVFAEQGRRVL